MQTQRLRALRSLMEERGVAAYVLPSSDPHQSEYPPEHWKHRAWLSGFHGSAGTVVVTMKRAGLWTDFRYFLDAESALSGSGIDLYRLGEPGVPDYPDWLAAELDRGERVAFDAECVSVGAARSLETSLSAKGIELIPIEDLVAKLREDRPPLPDRPVFLHDTKFAGMSRGEKLSALRTQMKELGADHHLISTLDDIAWLLNLRGSDVAYNPVAVAHLIVGPERALLHTNLERCPHDVRVELEADGVELLPYAAAADSVAAIPDGAAVIISPQQVSVAMRHRLRSGVRVVERLNLTTEAKARKNPTELDHLRRVMVRDGVAMVRFIHWLVTSVGAEEITELSAEAKLRDLRASGENYVSESFRTISAYRGHGAIVHYAASPETSSLLEPAGVYLVDSGAQYYDGTTDITRTVALGEASDAVRRDFTLVLKGHIGLATLRFPPGTSGHMIDAICREHLWRERMNYGHGTGHGVGFFLNVHEGPQRISQHPGEVALSQGMIVSNEPGVYRPDQYGIRIENLVTVVDDGTSEFGSFLRFETLTLCPIDRSLIDVAMLTPAERTWIDDYHRRVRDRLLGHLDVAARTWLESACAPLV
jgi:Xaa-Pro aminopeptidase